MFKQERRRTAKEYTHKKNIFYSKFANKLRDLKSNDPRQFWNLINKSCDKNKRH